MPGAHARLSPSAAARWIECPASVRFVEEFPRDSDDGEYAREGTAAHALAETLAGDPPDLRRWRNHYADDVPDEDEMRGFVQVYLDYLRGVLDDRPGSTLYLEQRLATGVPLCWGISDAVIVSPEQSTIEIVDLKYGKGVPVSAIDNPQARLYGVGALDAFGAIWSFDRVVTTIVQPRLDSISSEELSADDLRAWRDSLLPIAEAALDGSGWFSPSEKACRWCPASGACRAQAAAFARDSFEDPAQLSPEELARELEQAPAIKQWLADLERHALGVAYSGPGVPGWKVVASGGRRTFPDPEAAIAALTNEGYDPDEITAPRKLITLGQLEKLLGKRFSEVLGPYVTKTEGSPSLVRETDRRPPISATDLFEVLDD